MQSKRNKKNSIPYNRNSNASLFIENDKLFKQNQEIFPNYQHQANDVVYTFHNRHELKDQNNYYYNFNSHKRHCVRLENLDNYAYLHQEDSDNYMYLNQHGLNYRKESEHINHVQNKYGYVKQDNHQVTNNYNDQFYRKLDGYNCKSKNSNNYPIHNKNNHHDLNQNICDHYNKDSNIQNVSTYNVNCNHFYVLSENEHLSIENQHLLIENEHLLVENERLKKQIKAARSLICEQRKLDDYRCQIYNVSFKVAKLYSIIIKKNHLEGEFEENEYKDWLKICSVNHENIHNFIKEAKRKISHYEKILHHETDNNKRAFHDQTYAHGDNKKTFYDQTYTPDYIGDYDYIGDVGK